jgi:hypothetical protein
MLLLLVALISGEVNAQAYKLAALDAAHDEVVEVTYFRLEDEKSSDGAFAPVDKTGAFLTA